MKICPSHTVESLFIQYIYISLSTVNMRLFSYSGQLDKVWAEASHIGVKPLISSPVLMLYCKTICCFCCLGLLFGPLSHLVHSGNLFPPPQWPTPFTHTQTCKYTTEVHWLFSRTCTTWSISTPWHRCNTFSAEWDTVVTETKREGDSCEESLRGLSVSGWPELFSLT